MHVKNGPLGLWYGPLIFWMAHWNFEEGAMGPFSKNLSLSNICKIKKIYNIPLAVFEDQLQNLALVNLKVETSCWFCWYSYYAFKNESEKRRIFFNFFYFRIYSKCCRLNRSQQLVYTTIFIFRPKQWGCVKYFFIKGKIASSQVVSNLTITCN